MENNKGDVTAGEAGETGGRPQRVVVTRAGGEGRTVTTWRTTAVGVGAGRGGVVKETWGINITWQLLLLGKSEGFPSSFLSCLSFHCVTISLFNPESEDRMEGSWIYVSHRSG